MRRVYNLKPEKLNHIAKTDYQTHPNYVSLNFGSDKQLPAKVDLRPKFGPIRDQGNEGACTAFSSVAAYDCDNSAMSGAPQFQYYNERDIQGTIDSDSGATISIAVKALSTYGLCQEATWPYSQPFTTKPSTDAYAEASKNKALQYAHVSQTPESMKACLISGFPFVFGFTVYQSFESQDVAQTGMMPMPQPGEQILGGHAVVCCGYDDTLQCWLIRNSWGPNWGVQGYFYMPYAYLDNNTLCSDLWVITRVTVPTVSGDDKVSFHHHGHTGHTGVTGHYHGHTGHTGVTGDPPHHEEEHHHKRRNHCRRCRQRTRHVCKHCRRCRECHERHEERKRREHHKHNEHNESSN